MGKSAPVCHHGVVTDTPTSAEAAPVPAAKRTRGRTLAWTASTYFGQGLPWSFLHQMGTEYLTAIRAPLEQIGYTSWLHGATSLKFLWSPIVDLFGTKRAWMITLQLVLGAAMVAMGAFAVDHGLGVFWTALAAIAIVHATHDIACDGFYMFAMSKSDQALYSGVRIAAFRSAMWLGSSVLVVLAGRTSWTTAFCAAGGVMLLVGAANALIVPRPAEAIPTPRARTRPKAGAFWTSYKSFFAQPSAALVLPFIFSYKLGDVMVFAMSRPLLRDIGVDTAHRGLLATPQILAHIGGAMLAGALIARVGLERCLIPITYLMAIPMYVPLALWKPGFPWVVFCVVIEQFTGGLGSTAHVVYMMRRCRRAYSASHYAFASSVVALGSMITGAFSGHLDARLGHLAYFITCFGFFVPSLLLVLIVPKTPLDPSDAAASSSPA